MLQYELDETDTLTEEKLTILSSSGPLTEMKFKPDSLATACNERERGKLSPRHHVLKETVHFKLILYSLSVKFCSSAEHDRRCWRLLVTKQFLVFAEQYFFILWKLMGTSKSLITHILQHICWLYLRFKIEKICWFVKIIMMNKTWKYHNVLLLTELVLSGFRHIFHFNITYFSRLKFPNLSVDFRS